MEGYSQLNFGKSFTGKTARMIHEIKSELRVVLVDPKCAQLVKLKGYDHLWPYFHEDEGRWLGKDFTQYFSRRLTVKFKVVVHFRSFFREQLELLCILLASVKGVTLAVDELGLFIPPGPAGALPPAITSLAVSGRHEGIKFTGTAQRPSLVHGTVRANAEVTHWYRITERYDVEVARKYMSDAFADALPSLPDYVCIETSDRKPAFCDESFVGKFKLPAAPSTEKGLF
jgi:hypothetical protein